MKIFHYRHSIKNWRSGFQGPIGFVPTMGALHNGHLSLVKSAKAQSGFVAVSIFINPRQFNNPEDFLKYPKTVEEDLQKLDQAGADLVWIPENIDLYDEINPYITPLGPLNTQLEGKFRPGHFQGVLDVVGTLFEILKPTDVFFGLKDLQQCMVIEKLIKTHFPQIVQFNLPTQREPSGLAMSSRNSRLSDQGKLLASSIYHNLNFLASDIAHFGQNKINALSDLKSHNIETEYLEWVQLPDMAIIERHSASQREAVVYAGYLEGVRLIDNVLIG